MYIYRIYGLNAASNIEMPLLPRYKTEESPDITLNITFGNIGAPDWFTEEENGIVRIKLGSFAIYEIDSENNSICCKAPDFNSFFSTLFNIPFSVYLFSKGDILFHSSSMSAGNGVIAFSGDKGMGKSTLVSALGQTGNFKIFGDDTLRITDTLVSYPAHNLIKITEETSTAAGISGLKEKNVTGKIYNKFSPELSSAPLNAVFQIYRNDIADFKITRFDNASLNNTNNVFIKNIVGLSYFPKHLMKKALKKIPHENLKIYRLDIPDNMDFLLKNSYDLAKKLLSEIII